MSTFRLYGLLALLWPAAFLLGAAAEEKETGTVEGKITLNGRPLAQGKIGFHPKDGKAVVAVVKNGTYTARGVPTGTLPVTIEAKSVGRLYSSPKTTPIQVEIKKGENVGVDIQLTTTPQKLDDKATAFVEGRVNFQGKPLPAGKIAFHPKEGKPVVALLGQDGTYSAKDVPTGTMRVSVESKLVPEKYASPETSGLQVELLKGKNILDIELK